MNSKKILAQFFRTSSGKEPVREWLKKQTDDDKKSIGSDIAVVEWTWPIGYPLVRKLDAELWEVRSNLTDGIARVFFTVYEKNMVLLHGIVKKSQKMPKKDLDIAKTRRNIVLSGGIANEK